jgi:S-adenosylmethionine synthetase
LRGVFVLSLLLGKEENMNRLFTSESVTEGHPDKLCDYISDSVLDACLIQDPTSRVACEVVAGKGKIFITGEITTRAKINIEEITRNTIKEIGYDDSKTGIDYRTCEILVNISQQSPDIAQGVDNSFDKKKLGAGDQGLMFGYATDETDNYMPITIYYAHKLAARLAEVRKTREIPFLKPDGKVQVTFRFTSDGTPLDVDTILISTQHIDGIDLDDLKQDVLNKVVKVVIPEKYLSDFKFLFNPTGKFVIGGPLGDSGLTGRKIIVDTYGGVAHHGGGAFSGKDPTKVDRSASYMARYIAKNLVANGYAKKCEIQIAYGIGIAEPISIAVNTFGTSKYSEEFLIDLIKTTFDLTPSGIIETLDLQRPIYKKTTNYGHFGKDNLPWEQIIKL